MERWEIMAIRKELDKKQIESHYNQRINGSYFKVGEQVFKKKSERTIREAKSSMGRSI